MSLVAIVIMCMVLWNLRHVLSRNDGGLPPFGGKGFNGVGRVTRASGLVHRVCWGLVGWWTGLQVSDVRQKMDLSLFSVVTGKILK